MDVYSPQTDLLKAISHPTRLAVLEILRDGEQCVCHMEAMLGIRQSSISQQLMVLREAGLLEVRRDVSQLSVEADVIKVTEYPEIMKYKILSTPGLVINEKVASAGRVPSEVEITTFVTNALAEMETA